MSGREVDWQSRWDELRPRYEAIASASWRRGLRRPAGDADQVDDRQRDGAERIEAAQLGGVIVGACGQGPSRAAGRVVAGAHGNR